MTSPLREKLLKLAGELIDEVNDPKQKAAIDIRVDVLKSATTLYLGVEKLSAKVPEDEPTGPGMNEWKRAIKGERADA